MNERQGQKAARFRALHEGDPFLIPNPWDAGTAKVLEALGFEALATSSAAMAFGLGRMDGDVTIDEVVAHVELLCGVTEVPVSVDLENGHGPEPIDVASAIERIAAAGAVGGSIEDYDPVADRLYDMGQAKDRLAAAVEAARALPFPFTLTARAENHVRGNPDLDDTIARLLAFQELGADVLFAPGLRELDQIRAVCEAVDRPLNVGAGPSIPAGEIFAAGAQRVSVGGRLAWTATEAMAAAAEAMRGGDLTKLADPTRIPDWLA